MDKSLELQSDGTYTLTLKMYALTDGYDSSSVMRQYVSMFFGLQNVASQDITAKTYNCIGKAQDGTLQFSANGIPLSQSSSGFNVSVHPDTGIITARGFDYSANKCWYNGYYDRGGKKLEITIENIRLMPDAGDLTPFDPYGSVSGLYQSEMAELDTADIDGDGLADARFPEAWEYVRQLEFCYDFGVSMMAPSSSAFFGVDHIAEIISLEEEFDKVTSRQNEFENEFFRASIVSGRNGKHIAFEPRAIVGDGVFVTALLKLATAKYEWCRVLYLPATTVLYEDDLASIGYEDGSENAVWMTDSELDSSPNVQSMENSRYGYDSSYADDSVFSNGSAHCVTVTRELYSRILNNDGAAWPMLTFEFEGTGIDIISRCASDSGILVLNIVPDGQEYTYTGPNSIHVLTYTGFNRELNQIPVLHYDGLEYGRYKVLISSIYLPYFDAQRPMPIPGVAKVKYRFDSVSGEAILDLRGHGEFKTYIDAIRVYNPLGDHEVFAYMEAAESGPIFKQARALLETGYVDETIAYYSIDTSEPEPVLPIAYDMISPNNEVYLEPNRAAAFTIEGAYQAVHISLKSPTGKGVIVLVNGEPLLDENGEALVIRHATEMYYDITSEAWNEYVTISCIAADEDGESAMLSIVNVKLIPYMEPMDRSIPRIVAPVDLTEFVDAVYCGVTGDADFDGIVTVIDALIVMRSSMGQSTLGLYAAYCADVDKNGTVNMADAVEILRMSLRIG